jgi:hypothetical protein
MNRSGERPLRWDGWTTMAGMYYSLLGRFIQPGMIMPPKTWNTYTIYNNSWGNVLCPEKLQKYFGS